MGKNTVIKNKKKCNKCGVTKNLCDFGKNKDHKYGINRMCKNCVNVRSSNYRKTKRGKLSEIYSTQRKSSKCRKHSMPKYSRSEFIETYINNPEFLSLFERWEQCGYKTELSPSFDRLLDSAGYSFDNLNKWMTTKENIDKGHADMRNGILKNGVKPQKPVVATNKKTLKTLEFCSASQAGRILNIEKSNIAKCCRKELKSAGGYFWKFKNKNN